ncbi:MAG: glycosyltransferase family 9 protein [Pirellulaceae bacterium]
MNARAPRILICRLSHIGDCLLTLPMVNALRANYADAFIAWIVEKPSDQLLRDHGAVDHLIVVRRGWLKSWQEVRRVRDELRSLDFDIALDPQGLTKSAVCGWLSGARRRIGFTRGIAREAAPWLDNEHVQTGRTHLVEKSLDLLVPLGVDRAKPTFDMPTYQQARRSIDAFLAQSHLGCDFAVVNPGAGWPSKQWPAERFGFVAQRLGQSQRLPSVVVWAGEQERALAETVVARSGGHAILAPPTSLTELAELCRSARLFLSSDSGPLHLAAALGTPCVGLYGPTRPADCGPYGSEHLSVQAFYQSGTSRQRRRGPNDAMRAINDETVLMACGEILARRQAALPVLLAA